AARDPAWYGLDEVELEKRRRWTSTAHDQIPFFYTSYKSCFRKQDEELDELSASVRRIGDVGLTIHDELIGQEKILNELGMEMETTSNRLDFVQKALVFVQKKVALVMKKAGAKGQIMMIAFLVVLFIILFILVFFT
ncbi:hypothetical protein BHE74_00010905, partial [Ensete ventricosum]